MPNHTKKNLKDWWNTLGMSPSEVLRIYHAPEQVPNSLFYLDNHVRPIQTGSDYSVGFPKPASEQNWPSADQLEIPPKPSVPSSSNICFPCCSKGKLMLTRSKRKNIIKHCS